MKRRNYSNFRPLEEIVDENESSSLIPSVCEEIVAYLEMFMSTWFDRYFDVGKIETSENWIMNPYTFNLDKILGDGKLK